MIARKLSSDPRNKLRIGLTLENQAIRTEVKDAKMEEIKKLTELAKNTPEFRENKIEAIKKQIQSGQYKISPEEVTESFVELYEKLCRESS